MSLLTIATLLCSGVSFCLMSELSSQNYPNFSSGGQTENSTTTTDESTIRPEITTPQGRIRGINMVTRYKRKIFGFIGIPYAQPPVEDLRFRAPLPAKPWNATLDASSDTEPCPQINNAGKIAGVEDCLHLNVFTPQLPTSDNSTLLPVMIYIIGGNFKQVNISIARFVPDFILDKDVVLVVPNFRVGTLGFLSTGDEVSPGNYGLKDIVQSLKWIQDSIQYFGGDPNIVTIFGGSSGAISIHLMALSPLSDGLFHRCITQSGTPQSEGGFESRELAANRSIQLGKHFGCPTNTSILLVDCLRGLSVSQLVDTHSIFYVWGSIPTNVWVPTSEPDIQGALLTDTPENLYAAGKVRDLPWIVSVNRDEGLHASIPFYENPAAFDQFFVDIDFVLPKYFSLDDTFDTAAFIKAVKSYYFNDLTADRNVLLANFTELVGDGVFVYPSYKAVRNQFATAKNPVFFCSFEYQGVFSHVYGIGGRSTKYKGVAHGNELFYLFGHQGDRYGPPGTEFSERDLVMADKMVQLWTSFAINGSPSIEDFNNIIWEPFSSRNNYLRIGDGPDTALEMKYDLYSERMKFWDEVTAPTAT